MKFEECWADLGKALALGDVARAWRIWRVLGKVNLDERDQAKKVREERDQAQAELKAAQTVIQNVRTDRDKACEERDRATAHVKALQDMTKDRDSWRDGFTALARWLTLLVTPKVVIAQVISSTTENPS